MTFIKNLGPIQKRLLLVLAVVLVVGGGIGVYKFLNKSSKTTDTVSKTTSNEESAQSDYKAGGKRDAAQPQDKPEVGVTDTGGSTQTGSNSAPIRSSDGVISVTSPAANSIFSSGSSLAGESSAPKVSYRLMDNVSGVTATGELTVVNGRFSGRFNFSTSASQGRLDVFVVNTDLTEKSVVEVPVRFR